MAKKIAITGGIGSGKSVVSSYLIEKGYSVFSCDEIYGEIIFQPSYIQKIAELFPGVVINGVIDRQKLAKTVFSNEEYRNRLNKVSHPLIMKELIEKMEKCKQIVFAEVPLLYEGGYEDLFDEIIVVKRDYAKRIQAIVNRDEIDEKYAKEKTLAQVNYDGQEMQEKLSKPNVTVVENNNSLETLKCKINKLLDNLS